MSWEGLEEDVPGMISRTRRVPSVVPSVHQSSVPEVDVVAVKKTRLPVRQKLAGEAEVEPRLMSLRRVVPTGVPSEVQSSMPLAVPLLALKSAWELLGERIKPVGDELREPEEMSLTRAVEAGVALVLQGSEPWVPLEAEK